MVLGITEKDMLDPSKVKVIDSIAGAGKSSMLDAFLRSNGIEYLRLTSTNTLKNDAIERFGGNVKTICAGLFDNSEGFRSAEKEVEYETVVIDEILQDGYQAVQWVINHVNSGKNIIVTTDSKQMLAPESEKITKERFEELIAMNEVVYSNINVTLRGVTQETRDEVTRLYNKANENCIVGHEVARQYKCDKMENITFDNNNVYLCHTKEIEHYLYKQFDLSNCKLIGKGRQSSKIPVRGKYPIFDELTAELKHIQSYYQAANIATPTRYQGSEVLPGCIGYYFIESMSSISTRELYTVVSRFKDIQDLRVVIMDGFEKTTELKNLNGIAVKELKHLILPEYDGEIHIVNSMKMAEIIEQYPSDKYYYSLDWIYAKCEDKIYVQYLNEKSINQCERVNNSMINNKQLLQDLKTKSYKKSLAGTLAKKTPSIHYDFMPKIYEVMGCIFKSPMINNKGKIKEEFEHQCDLFSAYGTVIKNSKMPIAKNFYRQYDATKLNWYKCNNETLTGKNNLITEDLAKELNFDGCEYVFSTDWQISNEIGDYIYETSRKSKEDKQKCKLNWGYFEKHYIDIARTGMKDNEGLTTISTVYTVNKENLSELFMCAIKSALAFIMLKARASVGDGYVLTDAIYYNGDEKPELPDWAWYRISTGNKDLQTGEYDGVEFQNYELKTRAEIKNEKKAERRRNATAEDKKKDSERKAKKRAQETPEQREARLAKDRERKRLKRAQAKQEQQ